MVVAETALSSHRSGKKAMAHCLDKRPVMDHQFIFGRPHRDWLADQSPGGRVEIVAIDDETLGVDRPVGDLRSVKGPCRQRQQVRLFLRMPIHGPCLGLAMDVHVGDLRQPPGRGFIQVLQGTKAPATK